MTRTEDTTNQQEWPDGEKWLAAIEHLLIDEGNGLRITERSFEQNPGYCSWELEIPGGSTFMYAIQLDVLPREHPLLIHADVIAQIGKALIESASSSASA